jgi:hypothetical protein
VTRAQQYVFHRLRGSGTIEAATLAGYSEGRPSPKARRLWEAARKIRHGFPDGALDRYEERIAAKAKEVEDMRLIHEAAQVVDCKSSTLHPLIQPDGQDIA